MDRQEEIQIMQRAIDKYGVQSQVDKLVEECSELIKAVLKLRYAKPTGVEHDILIDAVSEETADVEIMLEQVHMIYRNDEKVAEYREKKLERLKHRMDGKFV